MWFPYKLLLTFLHILAIPFYLGIFLFLVIYKWGVCLWGKIFEDFVGPIPSQNCLFLADSLWEKPCNSIIVGVELDEKCTVEGMRKMLGEVYNLRDKDGQRCYRELGYQFVRYKGHGFWRKVGNFKIRERIHSLEAVFGTIRKDIMVSNGDYAHSKYLPAIVEHLQRLPYKKEDPLWDVYLLHSYNGNPNRTLMFLRWHHLLADGMSVIKFFYTMIGTNQLPQAFPKPSTSLSQWNEIASSGVERIKTTFYNLTLGYVEFLQQFVFEKDIHALHFGKDGKLKLTGNWMCGISSRFEIEKLKKACKIYNCSILHIFLTAISNGVEKYFEKYHGNEGIPNGIHFMGSMPMPGHPNRRLVNHWCLGKLFVETGIQDYVKKINYFKRETRKCAAAPLPIISGFMFQYISGYLTQPLVDLASKEKVRGTVVFSNVVGPQEKSELVVGSEIRDMLFWMPISEELCGVISCNGGVRVCLNVDTGCIPSRDQLKDLTTMIDAEFDEICRLALMTM